jgi:hypothetical protein
LAGKIRTKNHGTTPASFGIVRFCTLTLLVRDYADALTGSELRDVGAVFTTTQATPHSAVISISISSCGIADARIVQAAQSRIDSP